MMYGHYLLAARTGRRAIGQWYRTVSHAMSM